MSSLTQWLDPMQMEQFVAEHLGRTPFARPGTAEGVATCCDWALLDDVLRAEPADVLVVTHSQQLDLPVPRCLSELHAFFARGIGIAVRGPERVSGRIAMLAREFELALPGDQRLIIFATPGGTNGFGWHYDAEDVFVIQTAGDKEYFLRPNTIRAAPTRGFQSDFREYRDETSPLLACRLLPGDWLYIPKGYWHLARAHEHSLSLSIGVFPTRSSLGA